MRYTREPWRHTETRPIARTGEEKRDSEGVCASLRVRVYTLTTLTSSGKRTSWLSPSTLQQNDPNGPPVSSVIPLSPFDLGLSGLLELTSRASGLASSGTRLDSRCSAADSHSLSSGSISSSRELPVLHSRSHHHCSLLQITRQASPLKCATLLALLAPYLELQRHPRRRSTDSICAQPNRIATPLS